MVVVQGRLNMLQHSSFWSVAVPELFLLLVLRHILKTQTRLTIDSNGIDFRIGQFASTFRWEDIDGLRSIVAAPRRSVRVVEKFAQGQQQSASAKPSLIYCKAVGADDLGLSHSIRYHAQQLGPRRAYLIAANK